MNKSWTVEASAKLSPSAPVSETRRFKPEGEEESRATEGREGEGFTLKYVDPRAILGLFSLHPAGCSGRIPVRHAGRERVCISYDTKTSHYFPLSLDRSAQPLPPSFLLFSSAPRGARGHVTTIMPVLLLSRDLPLVLLLSSSSATSFLPSFVLFHFPSRRR